MYCSDLKLGFRIWELEIGDGAWELKQGLNQEQEVGATTVASAWS